MKKIIEGSRKGYSLVSLGLDLIALDVMVRRNLVSILGMPIGIGKESDVVKVLSDLGEKYVIKFFRIGRISFRSVTKKRELLTVIQASSIYSGTEKKYG